MMLDIVPGPKITRLVYYHIPTDEIFMSSYIDAMFLALVPGVKWEEIEILGEL